MSFIHFRPRASSFWHACLETCDGTLTNEAMSAQGALRRVGERSGFTPYGQTKLRTDQADTVGHHGITKAPSASISSGVRVSTLGTKLRRREPAMQGFCSAEPHDYLTSCHQQLIQPTTRCRGCMDRSSAILHALARYHHARNLKNVTRNLQTVV